MFGKRILSRAAILAVICVGQMEQTAIADLCSHGTYTALSIDGTQGVLPDETNEALLPLCAQWQRVMAGSPVVWVEDDGAADNGKALRIEDSAHAEACTFYRETALLTGSYSANTARLTAKLKVDAPASASDFMGGTLGIFLEIDDGMNRIYMCLLNPDFAGGADPEVGIAGAGALNQYGTYCSRQVYWDDGGYHTFELTRNSDASATLIVDGDTSSPLNMPAGSLQPTSGLPSFSFGAAPGGISSSYWDRVEYTVVPVPSALLLASLGLSVAAWKLRRPKAL